MFLDGQVSGIFTNIKRQTATSYLSSFSFSSSSLPQAFTKKNEFSFCISLD